MPGGFRKIPDIFYNLYDAKNNWMANRVMSDTANS